MLRISKWLHGFQTIPESLDGITGVMITSVAVGNDHVDPVHTVILRAWSKVVFGENDADYHDVSPEVAVDSIDDDEPPGTVGIDLDGDGEDDVLVNIVQARPGATWTDDHRRGRDAAALGLCPDEPFPGGHDAPGVCFVPGGGHPAGVGADLLVWGVGAGPERELGRLPPLAGGGAADS